MQGVISKLSNAKKRICLNNRSQKQVASSKEEEEEEEACAHLVSKSAKKNQNVGFHNEQRRIVEINIQKRKLCLTFKIYNYV